MATNLPTLRKAIGTSDLFAAIQGTNFLSLTDTTTLTLDYLENRSGDKIQSRFLNSQTNDEDVLESAALTRIGSYIGFKYASRWNQLWEEYTTDIPLLNNINITEELQHGKTTTTDGTKTTTKAGSETTTRRGETTQEESYPTPRVTSRDISGGYTDTKAHTSVRTGTEDVTESFPEARKSTKTTTGGYKDTDTTSTTRTGTQVVSDSGETGTSVYGFNSATAVKMQVAEPDTTRTTSYGDSGMRDARAGDITRSYTDYKEETAESGTKKTSTTYGQDGLTDTDSGNVTRVYNDYSDTTTETGSKRLTTSYGIAGRTDTLEYANRSDTQTDDTTVTNSGTDTRTRTGYNMRNATDKVEILRVLYENPNINKFFEIVFSDLDEILTIPIFN